MPGSQVRWGVTSSQEMFFRGLILRIAALGFVRNFVTKTKLMRPLVHRFVAGETLDEAMEAAEALAEKGLCSSLDLLGENVATVEEARAAGLAYREIVDRIAASPHKDRINISIKLTALGLDQGDDVAEANFRELLACAGQHGIFVRADMESSEYTERTISMIERVFPDHQNTGTVLQAMLRRTQSDVERLIKLGCRLRIVKGAYLEPAEVAFQDKGEVDMAYVDSGRRLLESGGHHAIASQDEAIVSQLKAHAESINRPKRSYEWQMLYGIRRDLQESLSQEGHLVRVYIPYGSQWYPYFSRRLAERPANILFILKSVLRK